MSQTTKKLPRGIRNNNPLNIRIGNNWIGEVSNPTDKQFEQFSTMYFGVRAAFIILRNYIVRYKLNTVEKIIQRWAPSTENNTSNYIKTVCNYANLGRNEVLDFYNYEQMQALFMGMCYVENGLVIDIEDVRSGYELVYTRAWQ